MKIKLLLFALSLLIIAGCASRSIGPMTTIEKHGLKMRVNEEVSEKIERALDGEFSYINTIVEGDFKDELLRTLSFIHEIDYSSDNCSTGQMACSDKMNKGKIFINERFFQMHSLEQFTSLLHEARHIETKNFEHVKCTKRPEWGHECDESINSPYGIEYKYLLHKLVNLKDEQSAQVLHRIFLRVNKI